MMELTALKQDISGYGKVLVCFSGGADSTALLDICRKVLGENAYAFTAGLPTVSSRSRRIAQSVSSEIGCVAIRTEISEKAILPVLENREDRCYLCKCAIYREARKAADRLGIRHILCGDNADDDPAERPGMRAAEEFGVLSPFRAHGIGKESVHRYIGSMGLGFPIVKETCLLMRYPAGTPVTEWDLRTAEEIEERIRSLTGVNQLRARFKNKVLEVQTSEEEMGLLNKHADGLRAIASSAGMELSVSSVPYRG